MTLAIVLAILIACLGSVNACCQVTVDIAVHVRSTETNEPIPGASVRMTDLDEPIPRESASGLPDEQLTDDSGDATLHPEFDLSGGDIRPFPFLATHVFWTLQGALEIAKEGYQPIRDKIVHYTGRISYPAATNSIEVDAFLGPAIPGGEAAPLRAIGFDPYRFSYLFRGREYGVDSFWNSRIPTIVEAAQAAAPADDLLAKYVEDYRRKVSRGRALLWGGATALIAGGACELYFLLKPDASTTDRTLGYISAGIGISGGIACFTGLFWDYRPTALVEYFNKAYRR